MHVLIKKDKFVTEQMREALPVEASVLMADRASLGIRHKSVGWQEDIKLVKAK